MGHATKKHKKWHYHLQTGDVFVFDHKIIRELENFYNHDLVQACTQDQYCMALASSAQLTYTRLTRQKKRTRLRIRRVPSGAVWVVGNIILNPQRILPWIEKFEQRGCTVHGVEVQYSSSHETKTRHAKFWSERRAAIASRCLHS